MTQKSEEWHVNGQLVYEIYNINRREAANAPTWRTLKVPVRYVNKAKICLQSTHHLWLRQSNVEGHDEASYQDQRNVLILPANSAPHLLQDIQNHLWHDLGENL